MYNTLAKTDKRRPSNRANERLAYTQKEARTERESEYDESSYSDITAPP